MHLLAQNLNIVIGEKDICSIFSMAECYLSRSNGHHRTANNKKIVENFYLMDTGQTFWPLASPFDHNPSKPQEVDKLRRDLSFSSLPFPFPER